MTQDNRTVRVQVSPEVARRARREILRAYRFANGGWAVLGIIVCFAGLTFFLDPSSVDKSAIGKQLRGPVDEMWNAAWLLGGALIAWGSLKPDRLVELFGQCLFVVSVSMYTVAIFTVTGTPPGAFLALAIGLGSAGRVAYLLLYAQDLVLAPERRDKDEPFPGEDRRDDGGGS